MKAVLTSLRSRKLDASIVLDGVIPHAAIKLFNLLGVPGSALKSLLARLIQDNMRDVHRLFTLHKVFTLRIWTQAGVAFRSLPDNLARPLAPEPTPSQTVASTEPSRQSPCPSGDRSLQSPAAPRRSPRVPSRSASRGGGTPVSSLLTAAVVSLQDFASQDTPNPLGRAVVQLSTNCGREVA